MKRAGRRGPPLGVLAAALALWIVAPAWAENVDPSNTGAQYAWGENIGWLNAEPQGDGGPGMTVGDVDLTGWIWAGDHGWISLSCQNTSSCSTNDYGISNDGKGNLSGLAWGEHLGWISLRNAGGSDCCSISGTPGCTDQLCETTICSFDPYCCNTEWDEVCAITAELEPACEPGCADNAWGVAIHGLTGQMSGFAWSESAGWINFGSALMAEPHQIVTRWTCPDRDNDGVCTASDNCAGWANTEQEQVLFGQTALAATKTELVWPTPVEWRLARGSFTTTASVGSYAVDLFDSGFGTTSTDLASPGSGSGYWYLVRPDCPIGSYSSSGPFEQGDRDGALIP